MKNAAAKTAKADSKETRWLSEGKKFRPKMTAKNP
jgi:hypothetical protein